MLLDKKMLARSMRCSAIFQASKPFPSLSVEYNDINIATGRGLCWACDGLLSVGSSQWVSLSGGHIERWEKRLPIKAKFGSIGLAVDYCALA